MTSHKFDHSPRQFFLTPEIRATLAEFAGKDQRMQLSAAMYERHQLLPSEVFRIVKQVEREGKKS